ncbi:MAG: hypothetical protein COW34_06735 [Armatimonadetes bacterium CG17_big_fil_post_rev_8_21_14_2_50_66_6]|nr:MAG: hypothetical protein COW34_06735 [Armatimonadetes bacterium CG17_big_fil_post_rev_8_21_14_2_50_66_6]
MNSRRLLLVSLAAFVLAQQLLAAETTFESMLTPLTDLQRLATLPDPGETCKQFSSYDPSSKYDAAKDEHIDWGANGDCGHFLREEPAGMVLADMQGPGCVVRIWSANPAGTLKLFFDGEAEPRFAVDFQKLIAGEVDPFAAPVVGMQSRGANCFIPFPYAKSCKVVVENPGSLYYHVNYRSFAAGAQVRTFAWLLGDGERRALAQATEKLAQCGPLPQVERAAAKRIGVDVEIQPGEVVSVARITGQRAIVGMSFSRLQCDSVAEERKVMRTLTLKAYWDDEKEPSIRTPLGDFFGTAPGYNVYQSLPLGMTEDGEMYSRWYMPFQKSAALLLSNAGDKPVRIKGELYHDAQSLPADKLAYFHAKWRREFPTPVFDWPLLECTGRGRYAGVSLTVWNPNRGWWGEGDEKVYVDGEKFPSTFGTGSEDYFGYAWCCPDLFVHPLHNQPLCEGPGNGNYTSVNRWHVTDDLPFQQSYRMTIENYAKDKDYACTTYWYAAHPQTDFFTSWTADALQLHERWAPHQIEGAIEGEGMKVLKAQTTGELSPQDLGGFQGSEWSNDQHLWFRPKAAGEWFELAVPANEAGKRRLIGYFTKARDYGIAQLSWNGTKVGEPLDAFNSPDVVATGAVDLGVIDVKQGENALRIEVTGKNGKSVGFMFGVDCVVFKPE